jgi:hypothetical protein
VTSLEPAYSVVWPQAPLGVRAWQAAPRVVDLNRCRVGFIWDYMFRGEELFPVLERELKQRFPGIEIVGYDSFGHIHGPNEKLIVQQLPDNLQRHRIDAVVVGNGC